MLILIMMNVTNQSKSTFNLINSLSTVNSSTFNLFEFISHLFGKYIKEKKNTSFMLSLLLLFNFSRLWFCTLYSFNRKRFSANCTANVLYSWLAVCQTAPVSYIAYYCIMVQVHIYIKAYTSNSRDSPIRHDFYKFI